MFIADKVELNISQKIIELLINFPLDIMQRFGEIGKCGGFDLLDRLLFCLFFWGEDIEVDGFFFEIFLVHSYEL
jgi:hypothetical protein